MHSLEHVPGDAELCHWRAFKQDRRGYGSVVETDGNCKIYVISMSAYVNLLTQCLKNLRPMGESSI